MKVMIQSGPQYWKWSNRDNVILHKWCDVITNIDPPVIVSNRGTCDNNPKKWLDGPIKHSVHHRAEFVILSVVLHSDIVCKNNIKN